MVDSSGRGTLTWIIGGIALIAAMTVAGVAAAWTSTGGESRRASIDLSGLGSMPVDTRAAYEAAPMHRDLFAHLPCYCGCGLLKEPHASLGDVPARVRKGEAQGLDHAAIRARVDEKFARAGPPTDTPRP